MVFSSVSFLVKHFRLISNRIPNHTWFWGLSKPIFLSIYLLRFYNNYFSVSFFPAISQFWPFCTLHVHHILFGFYSMSHNRHLRFSSCSQLNHSYFDNETTIFWLTFINSRYVTIISTFISFILKTGFSI